MDFWFQIIVKNWVNGKKDENIQGIGARFGEKLPKEEGKAAKGTPKIPNPSDCCSALTEKVYLIFVFGLCHRICILTCLLIVKLWYVKLWSQVCSTPKSYANTLFFTVLQLSGTIALCPRGTCDFAAKAENAQSAGAAALVLINDGGCKFWCLICIVIHNSS